MQNRPMRIGDARGGGGSSDGGFLADSGWGDPDFKFRQRRHSTLHPFLERSGLFHSKRFSFSLGAAGFQSWLAACWWGTLRTASGRKIRWRCFISCWALRFRCYTWRTGQLAAFAFAVTFGFCMGADYMLIPLVTADRFGLASLGKLLALIIMGYTIGQWIAPWMAGKFSTPTTAIDWPGRSLPVRACWVRPPFMACPRRHPTSAARLSGSAPK